MSVPAHDNKFFISYKNFFLENIIKQKIKTIYLIGDKEIFLKNIFKKGCFDTEVINKKIKKIKIGNCIN